MRITLDKAYLIILTVFFFCTGLQGIFIALPNIILPALILFMVFICVKKPHFRKIIKQEKLIIYLLFIVIFLLIKSFIFQTFFAEIPFLSKYGIVLIVVLSGVFIQKKNIDFLSIAFILSTLIATFFSLFNLVVYYVETENFALSYGKNIDEIIYGGRVYASYGIVIASAFGLHYFFSLKNKIRYAFVLVYLFFAFFLLLIAARLALFLMAFIGIFYIIKNLSIKKIIICFTVFFLVLSSAFLLNHNLKNRFLFSDKTGDFITNFKKWEPRYVIWQCSVSTFNSENFNLIWGLSSKQNQEKELNNCYENSIDDPLKRKYFLREKFNSHNQYLDFVLYGGIVLLILIALLFNQAIRNSKKSSIHLLLIVLILIMFLLENLFHRQFGVYLIGISLFFSLKKLNLENL